MLQNNDNIDLVVQKYDKLSNRMDKIIKQGDRQQLVVLKLTEQLEEQNIKIQNLLNNSDQGFLYFNQDMIIGSEYSKEAIRIFDCDIDNKDITTLLYPTDKVKQKFLKDTLQTILTETSIRQNILMSLLTKEFHVDNKFIEVQYKVLDSENFMIILTDITSKKELANKIKDEQQILKMIVEVVSSPEQFLEIKQDYEDFASIIDDYKTINNLLALRMQIHTYKGLFAQKKILNIVKKLHDFEDYIESSITNKAVDEYILQITKSDMLSWVQKDIDILKDILGYDFFNKSNYIEIKKDRVYSLVKMAQKYDDKDFVDKIQELSYYNIFVFFSPYIKLVEQLSIRLNKSIKPLMISNDEIYIPNTFKPFLNSLVHIFRNSVDHGIETKEERENLNKPSMATIQCQITREDKDIIIDISDDGKGIDVNKIKLLAVEKGLYSDAQIEKLSNDDILMIIFQDSFSTSENITDISGRGVGLASVLNELNTLNGNMSIENKQGYGIKFIFTIPYIK